MYTRAPEHDRRINRGDDYAADAWRDDTTEQIIRCAVGHDPNLVPYCHKCDQPALRRTAPNGETYVSCDHCLTIAFDPNDAHTPEPSASEDEPATCHCGTCATWEVREGLMLHLVCAECYQRDFVANKLRWTAWEATELAAPDVWTAADQAYLAALDGKAPWPTPDTRHPTPDTRPAAKVNWSEGPAARLIPCDTLRQLRRYDPAAYRARLATLPEADLEWQAAIFAAYTGLLIRTDVTTEEMLARFRRSIAIHQSQAALKPTVADDLCPILFELALVDPCAFAEFLRAHSAIQRDRMAWRFAGWLGRRHGITVLPAYLAANWAKLLGDTETSAGRAVDAQQCAAVES